MAYAQRVPILTFVQIGLKRQGMLSDRFEWIAIETDLSPSFLKTEKFQQVFREWLLLVQEHHTSLQKTKIDPDELRVGELVSLVSQMKASQLWRLIGAVFAVIAGIAAFAFHVGQSIN
ncbi:MAG: hypothetical protein JSR32_09395 [Proteobacteria bacterium]|nr:hypothetical protein [Pseudomonadota bacterium]